MEKGIRCHLRYLYVAQKVYQCLSYAIEMQFRVSINLFKSLLEAIL